MRYCIFCRFEEDLGSEVVFCIDEWSIALGHRWVFLSVTFMTIHLFQFLPVRRSMTSFSFASQVLHGSTSTSSREWGLVAMSLPNSLASDSRTCRGTWCKWTAARYDFGIQPGMGTCGHDTSSQFGERLLVHVKDYDANGWMDCVQ